MKKVVLFKGESEEYREAFLEAGFAAVFVEPLQFACVGGDALAAALLRPEYEALALTSPRAVDALAARWDPARFVLWHARRVYAVGEATARRAKAALGLDALGAGAGSAENLAHLIAQENPKPSKFLFPCGNLSSETLPSLLSKVDIAVDSMTVYETKENVNLKKELMAADAEPRPCCLVFFSPSGVEYVHRQLQTFANRLSELPRFAIGSSTASKLEFLGVRPAGVAAKPRPDCLVESVQKYFAKGRGCS